MPAKKKETEQRKAIKSESKKTLAKTKRTKESTPPPHKKEKGFYIVGMGASAGGLEAFEKFFRNTPGDSGMAFVLVSHLDPTHISILAELVQRCTKMEVIQVQDGMRVQPNSVYVIPPNRDMAILHGTLQLIELKGHSGLRLPIDYFLHSLAEDQGERAICIILSGTGSDGTLGVRAIKSEMGMVMVQDPSSAKYNNMPSSVIETDLMDYVLPPQKMPKQLLRYIKHATLRVIPRITLIKDKIPDTMQKIFILLRAHTGHDFSLYKKNMIFRRIERRMNVHQIDNATNYVHYLQENPDEVERLFKELLIGVTSFFRDPEAFEALRQKVLPQLLKDKPVGYSLRVWVPGCSSGEEVYSTAIILRECMDELERNFSVQIFGTDISDDAIDTARAGIYPASISAAMKPDRLRRFFTKEGNAYRIKRDIREMVMFATQDIIKHPPFTKLDLICCRNLLIYLGTELQKMLIPLFHYILKPDGILLLGTSETIGEFVDLFSVLDKKWKVYKRKETVSFGQEMLEFPTMPLTGESTEIQVTGGLKKTREISILKLVQTILLESYAPPCVIINQKADIIYIHGRTGKYLEPAPGEASLNILEMAREGLRRQLASAIDKAISQEKDVTHEGLPIRNNGGFQIINVTVKPFRAPEAMRGLMMVVFEDVVSPEQAESGKKSRASKKIVDKSVEELDRELQYTKENLQTTIEELETSNEELKSTNEELQSTNEELQSSNEELSTSKEELQSLNEELVTVNSELQEKIDDVTEAKNDMNNLMEATEIATIFLDKDMCIKGFTSYADKIINLIQSDVGRPIRHIASNLKYEKLGEDAKEVFKTIIHRQTEVQTKDGHWHLMRIMPYRTIDNVIDGVVITFSDIHEQKVAAEKLEKLNQTVQEAREYAESIVETVREPLLVMDGDLRVISVNRSFCETFQVKPEKTKGSLIYELGNRQWDIPRLRELLEGILPNNAILEGFEVEYDFLSVGYKKMLLNARKIFRETIGMEMILLAIEDITEHKQKGSSKAKVKDQEDCEAKTPKGMIHEKR